MKRVGIYAGTFNPVHAGHIAFALQAIEKTKLDELYFLPERRPRGKQGVEHFGHRVAMLNRAVKPYQKCKVLELTDMAFTVEYTLPKLQRQFEGHQLVFLVGSDVAQTMEEWPLLERLVEHTELVVGLRENDDAQQVKRRISRWTHRPLKATVIPSYAPSISSKSVRAALRKRIYVSGLLRSVQRYSERHWLYVSLS